MRSVYPQTENRRYTSTEAALLPIILVGHVGPCRTDTDGFACCPSRVADIVPPSGCTAEWPAHVLASERLSRLCGLRRERKKSCDGNHNLVEFEKATAQTEKRTREWGGR